MAFRGIISGAAQAGAISNTLTRGTNPAGGGMLRMVRDHEPGPPWRRPPMLCDYRDVSQHTEEKPGSRAFRW
jgi:hypothetical protein